MNKIQIAIFCLIFTLKSFSQCFKVVDNIKGFTSKEIFDIEFDKNGALWLSTYNEGCFKYDGLNFTNFIDTSNFGSYHSRRVYFDDTITFNCTSNALFKIVNGKMSLIKSFEVKQQFTDIKKIGHGDYLFSTSIGLYRLRNNIVTPIDTNTLGIKTRIILNSIILNKYNNTKYIASREGLYKLNNDLKKLIKINFGNLTNLRITEGFVENDTMYLPSSLGLLLVKNDKLIKIYNDSIFGTKSIRCIYKQKNKEYFWIFQPGKMFKFKNGKILEKYTIDDGLVSFEATKVIEDKEGNLIISTRGGGLHYFTQNNITNYNVGKTTNIILKNDSILFYSTNKGVFKLNIENKKNNELFNYEKNNIKRVLDVVIDKENRIWLYTDENKLLCFNKNKLIKQYDFNVIHPKGYFSKLFLSKKNSLWVSLNNGAETINLETFEISKFIYGNKVFPNYIKDFYEINDDIYALAGRTLFVKRKNDSLFKDVFPNFITVNTFVNDNRNNLWLFATDNFYSSQNGNLSKFQKKQDFSIFKISSTNIFNNQLIAYGEGGIYIFNLNNYYNTGKLNYIKFDLKSTFNANYITTPINYVNKKGELFFVTENGIIKFDFLNSINKSKYIKIQISNILLDYKLTNWDSLNFKTNNNIPVNPKFKYYQNNFTFQLSNLNLFNSENTLYQYKLIGFDSTFTKANTINQINYSNLPYGKYEFVAKAHIDGFNKQYDIVKYKFEILPAFYQTWWFKIIVLSFIILIIILIFKYRTYQIKEKNKLLSKLVNQKTEQLSHKVAETTELYNQIKAKNLTIHESMEYSKYIQDSILKLSTPTSINPKIIINELIYQPKEVIGGDFYMIFNHNNIDFIIVADCTGHGVPGALLTVLCKSLLNQIILYDNICEPGLILEKLNELLWKTFYNQKSDESSSDGLSITILTLNYQTHKMNCASSLQPFFLKLKTDEIIEVKTDSTALNINPIKAIYNTVNYDLNEIKSLLLFSDGIVDQKGETKGKKLFNSGLKKWYSTEAADNYYLMNLTEFKGNCEQRDDIMLISIHLTS